MAATQKQLGLTPALVDSKPNVTNQMPDALTKPPHNMMLALNAPSKNHINPLGHGVASTVVSSAKKFNIKNWTLNFEFNIIFIIYLS